MANTKQNPPKSPLPQPTADHVLVDKVQTAEQTPGGILIPEQIARSMDRRHPSCYGVAVAVGPDCQTVKEGDVVLFNHQESNTLEFGNRCVLVMAEMSIVARYDVPTARRAGLKV